MNEIRDERRRLMSRCRRLGVTNIESPHLACVLVVVLLYTFTSEFKRSDHLISLARVAPGPPRPRYSRGEGAGATASCLTRALNIGCATMRSLQLLEDSCGCTLVLWPQTHAQHISWGRRLRDKGRRGARTHHALDVIHVLAGALARALGLYPSRAALILNLREGSACEIARLESR